MKAAIHFPNGNDPRVVLVGMATDAWRKWFLESGDAVSTAG